MNKPRIAQINVEVGYGSTGKIAETISRYAIEDGMGSRIFYGRKTPKTDQPVEKIGNKLEQSIHLLETRFFDKHGKGSSESTKKLLSKLDDFGASLIHLHNIHGYYINYEILFEYIKLKKIPVVWTLHDCWTFTGHCTHFEYIGCEKWKTQCYSCELLKDFPSSLFSDRSTQNFIEKKEAFTGVENMTLVPVSKWLRNKLTHSFLNEYDCLTIGNGIDLDSIENNAGSQYPSYLDKDKKTILGVASVWTQTKGLQEFIKMSESLASNEQLVLVGLSKAQIKKIPNKIIALERTQNKDELIQLYKTADAFMNLTFADTYPTTNIEAMACGTPVIAYKTGGCTEMINKETGRLVEVGNFTGALMAFREICESPLNPTTIINYAHINFDSKKQLKKYLKLYKNLLNKEIAYG